MLVVSMRDRKLMRWQRGELTQAADLSAIATWHCNDMVVDSRGRAYVGNFGADIDNGGRPTPAALALVTPDGQARAVADQLLFPNGCVITPDGKTLIVAETFGLRLTAFDIAEDGSLSNRRLWAQLQAVPDGICLDAEGCVWLANPMPPGSFLRVAEGGKVMERIESGDRVAFACMLGGPERKTLFLLEAATLDPSKRTVRGNGRIRTVEVEVPGAGWPSWEA
jgi:sugar lactone lactonase YvrE